MAGLMYVSSLLLLLSLPPTLWGRVVMYPEDPYSKELSKPGFVPAKEPFTNLTMDQLIQQAYERSGVQPAQVPDLSRPDVTVVAEMDMKMRSHDFKSLYSQDDANVSARSKRKATRPEYRRWTNGLIPYQFIESDFNADEVYRIKEAMQEWEDNTCVRFRPARRSDRNKIRLQNGNGCNAWLGMYPGTNIVNLDKNGCRFKGLYLHELGHAIGLVHEHQLPDRDNYITINQNNAKPEMRIWFNKYSSRQVNQFNVHYEYSSVMHYGVMAFSKDRQSQTIRAKYPDREKEIGRVYWKGLSFSDIKVVNLMYKCNKNCPADNRCKSPGYLDKTCRCICPEGKDCGYGVRECKNAYYDSARCDEWAAKGECRNNPSWMWHYCKKSCGACPKGYVTTSPIVTKKIVTSSPKRTTRPTRPETTRKPTITSCQNKRSDRECEYFAKRGDCDTVPEWTRLNCAKACNTCPGTKRPTKPTTQRPTRPETTRKPTITSCQNKRSDGECEYFAKRGDCDTAPEWTRLNCAKACNTCPGTCFNAKGDKYCDEKETYGWCKQRADWMKTKCVKSCQWCEGDVQKACRDAHPSCQSWADAGYCENSQYTAKNCRKACKFC